MNATVAPTASAVGRGVRDSSRRPGFGRLGVRAFFLGPFYILFALLYVLPIGYAIVQSLFVVERSGGVFGTVSSRFDGLTQYGRVLTDAEFLQGLGRVGVYALIQVPTMTALAVAIALLLATTARRAAVVIRSIVFLPYAVPTVIAGIMWASLYQPATSPLDQMGIHIPWLGGQMILISIANIGLWAWTGFNVLVMVSALTSIPPEIIEAARIDGASEFRIAMSIKLPLIVPTIVMTSLFTMIGTLQLFSEPTILRSISTAITSGFTPNMLALSAASGNSYSYAAAISVTLAVITVLLSIGLFRIIRKVGQ
ncbi:carbohydrate ABC transporter permease [Herbiconiux sp. A18JL235]|uniref:Carbohydrate ABC transporter permease n=1 Tax=Herbiconiux sp. A18JL235 TaxID=3152363 RepID=A0AB39BG94_9MICO